MKKFLLVLLLISNCFAAAPWTIYNTATNGVVMTAPNATNITMHYVGSPSFHWVGDSEIGGRVRRSDTVTFSGQIKFWNQEGLNAGFRLGYFESQGYSSAGTDFCGLHFMERFSGSPGTMRMYPSIAYNGATLLGTVLSLETNILWGYGVTWTPTGGVSGFGLMSVSVTNLSTMAVQTTTLSPANDDLGFACNVWGLQSGWGVVDTEEIEAEVSFPSYTQIAMPPALPANMRVFILVGQSNARGFTGYETNGISVSDYSNTNTFIFTDTQWNYLRPGDPLHNNFGPEISFASALAAEAGIPVGIIKVAKGGTPLTQFLPAANTFYPYVVDLTELALSQLTTPLLTAVLSVQGESDADAASTATNYLANFNLMMSSLKTDLSKPTLTNILSRLHSWLGSGAPATNIASVRAAQVAIGHYVDTDDLTSIDTVHFDTASQLELGWRMVGEYYNLTYGPQPPATGAVLAYPKIVANAESLVILDPKGISMVIIKNDTNARGLYLFDRDVFYPTNIYNTFKPTGRLGRWLSVSLIPGLTSDQYLDLVNFEAYLALKANTNAFDSAQFDVNAATITIKTGANLQSPIITNRVGTTWVPISNSSRSHALTRANGVDDILRVDGGNSRLSIGTSARAPQAKLDVQGDVLVEDGSARFAITTSATPTADSIALTTGATGAGFSIRTATGEKITIAANGDLALSTGGPTISTGTGVPVTTQPNGSLFLRTDGSSPNLYVREAGSWVPK